MMEYKPGPQRIVEGATPDILQELCNATSHEEVRALLEKASGEKKLTRARIDIHYAGHYKLYSGVTEECDREITRRAILEHLSLSAFGPEIIHHIAYSNGGSLLIAKAPVEWDRLVEYSSAIDVGLEAKQVFLEGIKRIASQNLIHPMIGRGWGMSALAENSSFIFVESWSRLVEASSQECEEFVENVSRVLNLYR